jgi:hypothetical protein
MGSTLQALLLSYSLSGAAGLRPSLSLLIVSIAVKIGLLHPNPSLAWVASGWVMALAGAATLLELFADKVPVVDHALHAVHFALAPVVGAVTAMSGYQGDPSLAVIPAVLGGGNALLVHTARAGVRAATTASTFGLGNTLVSFIEDGIAALFILIAIVAPVLTALLLVVVTIWAVRLIRRLRAARAAQGPH